MTDNDKAQIKKYLIIGGSLLLLCALLWNYSTLFKVLSLFLKMLLPLLVGGIIAFIVNIPLNFYERHMQKLKLKVRRPLALVLALLTIVLIFAIVGVLVIPEFVKSLAAFGSSLKEAMSDLEVWITNNKDNYPYLQKLIDQSNLNLDKIDSFFNGKIKELVPIILGNAVSIIASTVAGITIFGFGFIFSIYLLTGKESLKKNCITFFYTYLPEKKNKYLLHVFSLIHFNFSHFLTGQCLDALILGSLCTLGMLILRLPSAPMIGALIGIAALIPIVGSLIGALIAAFIIFMDSPISALIFLIFLIILQRIDGDFIYPKVVGSSIGLPPIWVFAAVTMGGAVNGIVGMLVAVPTFAVIYTLVKENIESKQLTT